MGGNRELVLSQLICCLERMAEHDCSTRWAQDMENMLLQTLENNLPKLGYSLDPKLRLSHAHILDQEKLPPRFPTLSTAAASVELQTAKQAEAEAAANAAAMPDHDPAAKAAAVHAARVATATVLKKQAALNQALQDKQATTQGKADGGPDVHCLPCGAQGGPLPQAHRNGQSDTQLLRQLPTLLRLHRRGQTEAPNWARARLQKSA